MNNTTYVSCDLSIFVLASESQLAGISIFMSVAKKRITFALLIFLICCKTCMVLIKNAILLWLAVF